MIIWRKVATTNHFRAALHQLIEAFGDELLLSSGYVSHGAQFSVDDLSNIFPSLDIALKNGLQKITIRGGKFGKPTSSATYNLSSLNRIVNRYSSYQDRYEAFLSNTINFLMSKKKNIHIDAYIHNNWHAKVSVRADNGTPFAAIIGSSNLTSTAYGIFANNFNSECDVLIWRSDYPKSKKFSFNYDQNTDVVNDKNIHFLSKFEYVLFETLPGGEEERLTDVYRELKNNENGKRVEI